MEGVKFGAILALALLHASTAEAATFKCQGPDGKTVFSDQRCPPTDEQRLKELEVAIKDPKLSAEQKSALQLQIDAITQRMKEAAERKPDKKGERK